MISAQERLIAGVPAHRQRPGVHAQRLGVVEPQVAASRRGRRSRRRRRTPRSPPPPRRAGLPLLLPVGHPDRPSSQRAATRTASAERYGRAPARTRRPAARRERRGRRGGVVPALGRPGLAVVAGQQRAEEPLAAGRDQQRVAQGVQPLQVGQDLPVLLAGLGEAEPGVEHDLAGSTPGRDGRVELGARARRPTSATTSSYCVCCCISTECAAPVHQDVGRARAARRSAASRRRPARRRRR